jgi:hypothetical protein
MINFYCGFCPGTLGQLTYSGNGAISSAQARTGTYSFQLNSTDAYQTVSARSEGYIGMGIYTVSGSQNRGIVYMSDDATELVRVRINGSSRFLEAMVDGGVVDTSTQQMFEGQWYYIEIYVKIADSGGRIVVKVEGNTWIDYTGDTKPGSETTFNRYSFPDEAGISHSHIDDLVIRDDDWPGDVRVYAMVPNAAGDLTEWTPSAGSNWDCVEEVPASDSDYVESDTTDDEDLYNSADPSWGGTIQAVNVWARAKEGAAGSDTLAHIIKTTGSVFDGEDCELGTTYAYHYNIWQINPATSGSWTASELNSLQFGVKNTS